MHVAFAEFGEQVALRGGDAGAVHVHSRDRWLRVPLPIRDGGATAIEAPLRIATAPGPFRRESLGKTDRLSWSGGACTIESRAGVAIWNGRFAAVVDRKAITVIDGIESRQVKIDAHELWPVRCDGAAATAGQLAIAVEHRLVTFSLVDLVALFDVAGSHATFQPTRVYPLRTDAATRARVAYVLTEADYVINYDRDGTTRQLRVRVPLQGVEPRQEITLRDELWPGTWTRIEIPGAPDQTIYPVEVARELRARIVRGRAQDPALHSTPVSAGNRQGEVDSLLAEIARQPDDDAPRAVLVDVLNELDPAYGAAIAMGRRDPGTLSRAKKTLLGPLAYFLDEVEYRSGLPWTARLVRKVPADPALLDAAAGDLRLGMFHHIAIRNGRADIYARLVGSPRAVGLRHADIRTRDIARALIDGGHDQLTHLHDVRFAQAPVVELLAQSTFDRVTHVETIMQSQHLARWLERIARDPARFFARASRTLIVREQFGHERHIIAPILDSWGRLPVAGLIVGDLELVRESDGTRAIVGAPGDAPWLPQLRELAREVELRGA